VAKVAAYIGGAGGASLGVRGPHTRDYHGAEAPEPDGEDRHEALRYSLCDGQSIADHATLLCAMIG